MPVYEYRCSNCNKVFEYQQRMADPAKTTCEECAGSLERLISRSSFSFKGGGWYKDLYSSTKSDASSGSSSEASSSTPAPASTSSDSSSSSSPSSSGSAGSSTPAAAGPVK